MAKLNHYSSVGSRTFDTLNGVLLIGLALLTIVPFIFVVAGSFATEAEISSRGFFLWPQSPTTEPYEFIMSTGVFLRALTVTVGVTIVGTLVQVLMIVTIIVAAIFAAILVVIKNMVMKNR